MKNLKTYSMFESAMELTQEQVQWLNDCTKGTGIYINNSRSDSTWALNPQTGLVDVKGGFNCSQQSLTDFKGVRFGVIDGYFNCSDNALTSLEGAPLKVGYYFYCQNNDLTTLEGAPQEVEHDFNCSSNALTSLIGSPKRVGFNFRCKNNRLTSLIGAPQSIAYFHCENNHLTSLEGAPLKVGGGFFDFKNNPVSEETLDAIFAKMNKKTSYLAAVESLWSKIPQDDQALLYGDDFKWVTPEQGRGLVAIRAYQDLRGML